jgi:DNA-binding CsgD family transcriptional regulator
MYWDKVLNEVLNKSTLRLFTLKPCYHKKEIKTNHRRKRGMYKLGGKFNDIYFTRREAECMVQLLNGKTMRNAAKVLDLSVRTVEFYVKNMYKKLNCRTKIELIDLVMQSDFLNSIDF